MSRKNAELEQKCRALESQLAERSTNEAKLHALVQENERIRAQLQARPVEEKRIAASLSLGEEPSLQLND